MLTERQQKCQAVVTAIFFSSSFRFFNPLEFVPRKRGTFENASKFGDSLPRLPLYVTTVIQNEGFCDAHASNSEASRSEFRNLKVLKPLKVSISSVLFLLLLYVLAHLDKCIRLSQENVSDCCGKRSVWFHK